MTFWIGFAVGFCIGVAVCAAVLGGFVLFLARGGGRPK